VLFGNRAGRYCHPDPHSIPVGGGNAPGGNATANKSYKRRRIYLRVGAGAMC